MKKFKKILFYTMMSAMSALAVACFSMAGYITYMNGKIDDIAASAVIQPEDEYVTPEKVLEQINADPIKIIYTNDPELNCGVAKDLKTTPGLENPAGGCFRALTPDSIYMSLPHKDIPASVTRYLTLHEYGHYLQMKNGEPLDECAADQFAEDNGAAVHYYSGYDCEIERKHTLTKKYTSVPKNPRHPTKIEE